jgi:hypothetical protein
MREEHAKTKLDTAVYFLQVILLKFEYFYLYLSEKQFIFSIMALKLMLFLLVLNIFHICVVFSK